MDERWTVHKFGGSVLRGAPDLDRLADRVAESEGRNALVVSALWGTTDRLLRAVEDPAYAERLVSDLRAHHLMFAPRLEHGRDGVRFERVLTSMGAALEARRSKPSDRQAKIQLLATGERLSALVVAHHLRRCGLEAHAVGAEDIGLQLKGTEEAEAVDLVASRVSFDHGALHGIPVITGWLGTGTNGTLALLGRGGSDHTATAIANLLGARRVILWKDVEGIYPINPRWGLQTRPIPYITYEHAKMAASIDATVLHPASVPPCVEDGIPIEIRRLHRPTHEAPGTVVGPEVLANQGPVAASCTLDVVTVRVEFPPETTAGANAAGVLGELAAKGIGVHGSHVWSDGASLVIDAPRLTQSTELLAATGAQVKEIGEASAIVSVLGAWTDAQPWAEGVCEELEAEVIDVDAMRVRLLVPRDSIRHTLSRILDAARWAAHVA